MCDGKPTELGFAERVYNQSTKYRIDLVINPMRLILRDKPHHPKAHQPHPS